MNDDIQDVPTSAPTLEQVRQRFEFWRKRRKKRTRIPQNLWQAAIALSEEYSGGGGDALNFLTLQLDWFSASQIVILIVNNRPISHPIAHHPHAK